MNIAFYIDEMNFRGVANSSYHYSFYNQKILKNKSIIFYNKKNKNNKKEVIKRFNKKFKIYGIEKFSEIDDYGEKLKIDYIYVQKGGDNNGWSSNKIKTLIHCVYPQKLNEVHGEKYIYISEWLSKNFSNNKLPFVPLITSLKNSKENLKRKLKINKKQIVFGCHGGESSFDLKFAQKTLLNLVKERKDLVFIFLNVTKFCKHSRIIFLKGSSDEVFKTKFINTCDAMIYGRSLGESFGLACGEFSIKNKKIISYKFNRHRAHIYHLPKNFVEEYSSRASLKKIILNFDKSKKIKLNYKNKYLDFTPKKVMRSFNELFLTRNIERRLTFFDYFNNNLSFLIMHFQYLKHKIYNHYFDILESKFFFDKD